MGGERTGRRLIITAGLAILMLVAMLPGPSGRAEPAGPGPAAVDLSVAVLSELHPVPPGTVIAYEAAIRNGGSLVAEDTAAVFEIPASSISVDGTAFPCAVVGSAYIEEPGSTDRRPWTVRCDLGMVPPGAEIRLAFTVTSGSPGTQIAVARVFSAGEDAESIDNTVEVLVRVLPDAPEFTPAFQQPGPLNPSGRTHT